MINGNVKKIVIILLVLCLGGLAFSQMNDPTILLKSKYGIGNYLTDANGLTLYYFTRDSEGKSVCTGGCLDKWPIFYSDTIIVPSSLNKADFGVITRPDRQKQTTFRGYPLYYFISDKKAGDTTGQGVGNVWFVVDPAHFPVGEMMKK